MEKKPTLTLMVGLPGAGKTTRAKELEQATGAVRFTPDEWHLFLFGDDFHDPREHALHDQRHDRNDDPTVSLLDLESVRRCISCLIGHHYPVFSCFRQHFAERVFHLLIVPIHFDRRFFRQIGKRYAVLRCSLILHAFKFQRRSRRIHCNSK